MRPAPGVRPASCARPAAAIYASLWLLYPLLLFGLPDDLRGPLPFAPETALQLLLLYSGIMLDLGFRQGRALRAALRAVPLPLWAFIVLVPAGWAWSGRASAALYAHFALWVITALYALFFITSDVRRERLFRLWIGLALIGAAWFLLSPARWGLLQVDLMAFQHRTGFAYFLSVPTAILAHQLFVIRVRRLWLLRLAAFLLLTAALLLAYSRGPWLVVLVGLIVLLAHQGRKWTAIALIALAAGGAGLLAYRSESPLALRLRSTWDLSVASSSNYRVDLLLAALKAVPDIGILGAGPGSAGEVLARNASGHYSHMTPEALAAGRFVTDSDLTWLLSESGPLATLALLAVLITWAYRLRRRFRETAGGDEAHAHRLAGRHAGSARTAADAAACSVILLVLFCAMILLDNILTSPFGWFLLGTGLSTVSRAPAAAAARAAAPVPAHFALASRHG